MGPDVDPAYVASEQPIFTFCKALWEGWIEPRLLSPLASIIGLASPALAGHGAESRGPPQRSLRRCYVLMADCSEG
eukprot:9061988-Prorocentrum_lima.AAC.1